MKKIISFLKKDAVNISIGIVFFLAAVLIDRFFDRVLPLYVLTLLILGIGTYIDALKGIARKDFLDERFLTSIASIGAFFIGDFTEGIAVMLFYRLGEAFESMAVKKSRGKIRSLMSICPDEARIVKNGEEITVDADDVSVGDIIVLRAGERVAVDSLVISGSADVDTSALTGESIPRSAGVGSFIESGSIVLNGSLKCEAVKEAGESSAQRILDMVESANENKAPQERFITSFSKIYTPIVVSLAIIMAILPGAIGITEWRESIYRALMFLVISCPCALVISVPLSFFGGIGSAASRGILFKGASSFLPISKIRAVAFDKTGTLTTGNFRVSRIICNDISEDELISLAASVEKGSNHPIARCISALLPNSHAPCEIKEIPGKGAIGLISGKRIGVGNASLMSDMGVLIPSDLECSENTLVYCACDEKFIGAFCISDDIKPEAENAIKAIRKANVSKVLILSGDKKNRAKAIGKSLGVDEVIAELMPEDKYFEVEKLKKQYGSIAYVGDGINDAPALALADVGIAMGGIGSDAAIESADIVITSDNILRIHEAIKIASASLSIAKQNIAFALGVKLAIMVLAIFGIANMWLAVIADVGVAVLAILNSMRTLLYGRRTSK